MNAYPETLLPDARSQLADATDYAVIDMDSPISNSSPFSRQAILRDASNAETAPRYSASLGLNLPKAFLQLTMGRKTSRSLAKACEGQARIGLDGYFHTTSGRATAPSRRFLRRCLEA